MLPNCIVSRPIMSARLPGIQIDRRALAQRHSPGPDLSTTDVMAQMLADIEPQHLGRIANSAANAVLRFDESARVSQPGEGRVAEQGQIASGRVIPNNNATTNNLAAARLPAQPGIIMEVKRVLKRKQPQTEFEVRPGQRRLLMEAQDMDVALTECCQAAPKADDLYEWTAVIEGPKNSVYEGGTFFCTIFIPQDYPFSPPRVVFHTRIYHCNINAQGEVCLDILKDRWNTTMSIETILNALLTLMTDCNPDDALVCQIGRQYKEDREQFDKMARLWTRRYASS